MPAHRFEAEALGDTSDRFALVTDFVNDAHAADTGSAPSASSIVPTSILLLAYTVEDLEKAHAAVLAWLSRERCTGLPLSIPAAKLEGSVDLLRADVEAKAQIKVGLLFAAAAGVLVFRHRMYPMTPPPNQGAALSWSPVDASGGITVTVTAMTEVSLYQAIAGERLAPTGKAGSQC
jgi:hypothetical protein